MLLSQYDNIKNNSQGLIFYFLNHLLTLNSFITDIRYFGFLLFKKFVENTNIGLFLTLIKS